MVNETESNVKKGGYPTVPKRERYTKPKVGSKGRGTEVTESVHGK